MAVKTGSEWKACDRLLDTAVYHQRSVLRCPACDGRFIHLAGIRSAVGVDDQENTVMAERVCDGDFPFESEVDPLVGRRGAQTEIGCWCEGCSAVFVLGLQFHKGIIFVGWKPLGDVESLEQAGGDLWRD